MTASHSRLAARAAALAAPVALALSAPLPPAAVHQLDAAGTAVDPLTPLLAAISLAAWSLVGWLLLVAAVALAGRAPGPAGRVAAVVGRRIAPGAVRRLVGLALGVTIGIGGLGTGPAWAGPTPSPAPAASPSLHWPVPAASPLDWPATSPTASPVRPAPPRNSRAAASVQAAVVVQPGDSLWRVAADHLPAGATDAQIAQAWPRWWSANRAAVGADPDLIHPGLVLTPPAHR